MGLFDNFKALFDAPEAEDQGFEPSAVALAALMVRLAKADDHYAEDERAAIEAALDARFGDGAALLAAGEAAEADALDHQQFTRLLKAAHAHEDRAEVLEDLWAVVLVDGTREAHEDALMRQIGSLLHVSDQEMQKARRRVEAMRG